MEAIEVTLAQETDAAACLALLPEAVGAAVELLVAKRGHAVVGAAALRWQNLSDPPGFALSLHVLPPERRRGIGRMLLGAAIDLALDDAVGLWSFSAISDEAAIGFLLRCGFAARRREHHFDAAIDAMLGDVGPTTTRLRDRGRVPEDLRIEPLASAPLEAVAELVAVHLRSDPGVALDQLRFRLSDAQVSQDRSRVAMRGAQVEGVILWQVTNGVAKVEARVVHPRNRGGWLNAVLLEEGLTRGRAEGLERLRFHCEDTVRDTINLAKRCQAIEVARPAFYYRSLVD